MWSKICAEKISVGKNDKYEVCNILLRWSLEWKGHLIHSASSGVPAIGTLFLVSNLWKFPIQLCFTHSSCMKKINSGTDKKNNNCLKIGEENKSEKADLDKNFF